MTTEKEGNWWKRPCGGRDVLKLALPLVISTASWSVMNFCDRMFLLWHSTREMAAAMPAGMLYFTILCFPLGIVLYVNTFVAQYKGAGQPEKIGLAVWHGVRVALFAFPLFLATIPLAPIFFRLIGHDPEVAALEVVYYQILAFGAGGHLVATALSTFFTGRGETRTVMLVSVSASLLNIVLDYAWIFGRFGFPELGIEGAAWATVVSLWYRGFAYVWLMMRPINREKYHLLSGRRFDAALFRRLLRYGGPNGLQLVVEMAAFAVFILLVGRLGEHAMAATTLAFNVNALAFVPLLGMGVAVSTMVGQQLGRNRPDMAAQATWTSLGMAMTYMGIMAALYLLVPTWFLIGHASGVSPEEFAGLRDTAVVLLRFVAAYCLFDALSIIFASAIKGAGDTHFILWTNLLFAPLPVAGAWLGITYFGCGLIWCWWMLTAWVCVLGLIYLARFLQGRWRNMRVIEPRPTVDGEAKLDETRAVPDVERII
ncbi:MAG: MATE family efflux transporter [Thermoguttaceae bacterium]